MTKLDFAAIHQMIGKSWPQILAQLGIDESYLTGRHGPCPACAGRDRFRFTNYKNRGGFICGLGGNGCGTGDGFELLMRVHGWSAREVRSRVIETARLEDGERMQPAPAPVVVSLPQIAQPTGRVKRIRQQLCAVDRSDDAVRYLSGRGLWPLPASHTWRVHASLEYWNEGASVGRYPALVADVRDVDGDLVTVHVTYLENGAKLAGFDPRKILNKMHGRIGCAVRIMPLAGEVLGIAEGIETALSAATLHNLPVWSTLNASLLSAFEPPPGITKLVLFTDRDTAGALAVARLMERLQGRYRFELKSPPQNVNDWNDVLKESSADDFSFGEMQA